MLNIMDDTDSDEDTFVTVGTPLAPYEEGEALKKPTSIHEQQARDLKGRARFHGAFTGGFSAGYFNTVGSKEGFVPDTFVSSRTKRNESSISSQKPEDFMDDEDFAEHGIAPKVVSATTDFVSSDKKRKEPHERDVLEELVVPSRTSVGITLLRQLGWKDGQGIGPRQRRKQKKKNRVEGKKVYGCALPDDNSEEGSDEENFIPANVTFAPKDVNPIQFHPKDDVHGLGYSGINPRSALTGNHFSLFEESGSRAMYRSKGTKMGLTGQAFGVGMEEDEDDADVYGLDSMDKYDRVLGGPSNDKNHGWTAPRHHGLSAAPVGYIGKVLEGFKLSTSTLKPKKIFPPPHLPRSFKPFHKRKFEEKNEGKAQPLVVDRKHMDANVRKNMLGEIKSVFDLVPTADKAKMEAAKEKPVKDRSTSNLQDQSRFDKESSKATTPTPGMSKEPQTAPLFKGSTSFKPFAKDPAKQLRYEQYLELTKKGKKAELDSIPLGSMTEWERNKEKEEFARAAQLYRPLSTLMASRFTTARFQDDEDTVEMPADEATDKSDQKKAAEMKMFGKLTRERFEWHPDRVLCKRFNIANPYPESTLVGVPKVKRDKYSVFNFLNNPTESEVGGGGDDGKNESEEKALEESRADKERKDVNFKPLAILAREDLSFQSASSTAQQRTTDEAAKGEQDAQDSNQDKEQDILTESSRPTMDIFKAIFSESSDEESSSEDEIEQIPETSDVSKDVEKGKPVTAMLASIFGDTSKSTDTPQTHEDTVGTIPVESIQQRLSPHTEEPNVPLHRPRSPLTQSPNHSDLYGPALPPGFNADHPGESNTTYTTSSNLMDSQFSSGRTWVECVADGNQDVIMVSDGEKSEKKRHKSSKHKHKLKKKKSKHKKLKYKDKKRDKKRKSKKDKKKKKKKDVIEIESSSSSSSSSDDNSDSEVDAKLIHKLKTMTEYKRAAAADFM